MIFVTVDNSFQNVIDDGNLFITSTFLKQIITRESTRMLQIIGRISNNRRRAFLALLFGGESTRMVHSKSKEQVVQTQQLPELYITS